MHVCLIIIMIRASERFEIKNIIKYREYMFKLKFFKVNHKIISKNVVQMEMA